MVRIQSLMFQHTFVSMMTFLTSLICVLLIGVAYSVDFHPNSCYLVAGIAGIVSNLFGFCHFKTLMNRKKELDVHSSNNKRFDEENHLLLTEVNRFSQAKTELQDKRGRIREVIRRQEGICHLSRAFLPLKTTDKHNFDLLGQWKKKLISKERKMLYVCFDRFEWEAGQNGITREQFTQFKRTLPMKYQLRFTRYGDWRGITGDDGVLQLEEFFEFLDKFAEDIVIDNKRWKRVSEMDLILQKHKKHRTQLLMNGYIRQQSVKYKVWIPIQLVPLLVSYYMATESDIEYAILQYMDVI